MTHQFTLEDDDFTLLLIVLGMASGAAYDKTNKAMFHSIIELANTINKDNPDWTPYNITDDIT